MKYLSRKSSEQKSHINNTQILLSTPDVLDIQHNIIEQFELQQPIQKYSLIRILITT